MSATQLREIAEGLFENKDFFGLRDFMAAQGSGLSKGDFLFFSAVCENMLDNISASEELIAEYLTDFMASAEEEYILEILKVHADNLLKQFRYADAASVYGRLQAMLTDPEYSSVADEVTNSKGVWEAVAHIPPMRVSIEADTVIPCHRNEFGHIMVEAATDRARGHFMFDTGANLSSVTRSWAERMGMDIFSIDVKVVTSTGATITTEIAVAPRFMVGDVSFENVIFLVIRDEELAFEELDYAINGIVGLPAIRLMREVRIRKNEIIVPAIPVRRPLSNLCFEGLMPLISAHSGGEKLTFTFDTGANRSELSHRYYMAHKDQIESTGTEMCNKRAGGGGIVETRSYELSGSPISIGGQDVVMPQICVSLEEYIFNENKDGNLGLDLLDIFEQTTICFEYMYVALD